MPRRKDTSLLRQPIPVTNEQRQKVRKARRENPHWTQDQLAKWTASEFGREFPQSVLSKICSQKWAHLDHKHLTATEATLSKNLLPHHPDLELALAEYLLECIKKGITVTGFYIQGAASKLWHKMAQYQGQNEPSWSKGWLEGFKKRHRIRQYVRSGESADVDEEAAAPRLSELRTIVAMYESHDIYNCDETGLFWRMSPAKTLASHPVNGGKKKKKTEYRYI